MIVNAPAVVLSRRDWREADRLAVLYTESLGKLAVRFAGVNRAGRKLKALSEPAVCGEFRLYISPRSEIHKAVGGALMASYPGVRRDLSKTVTALALCEMLSSTTPLRSPNPAKYRLIREALEALEAGTGAWIEAAFGLRLLELTGHGLSQEQVPPGLPEGLWHALHCAPLSGLCVLPCDQELEGRVLSLVHEHVEAVADRPLKCRQFRARLAS